MMTQRHRATVARRRRVPFDLKRGAARTEALSRTYRVDPTI